MDNAKEYFSAPLKHFYHTNHITTHPTIPHTPQENALAERVNRTLMETVRALLLSSSLPSTLWDYALLCAVEYHKHSPHTAHGKTPIGVWTNTTPDVSKFLPFGQYGYVHSRKPVHKLAPRAELFQYIGRIDDHHHHIYNPASHTVTGCRASDFKPYDPNIDPVNTSTTKPISQAQTSVVASHSPTAVPFTSPKNLKQARTAPDAAEWEKSWNAELDNLEERGTIKYVPRSTIPSSTTLIPVKFVLKTKTDANGNPVTRKTRCNIRGDLQQANEHCGTTLVLEVAGTSHGHAVLNETNKSTRWCFDCMFGSR